VSSGGEGEIYCDLDAMDAIGAQLRSIHAALDDVGDRVDVYDACLGSSLIDDAIDRFVNGWKDGRKEIREGVAVASANVKKAAERYKQAEDQLTAAARGEPGS
jgi:hypothetical protein